MHLFFDNVNCEEMEDINRSRKIICHHVGDALKIYEAIFDEEADFISSASKCNATKATFQKRFERTNRQPKRICPDANATHNNKYLTNSIKSMNKAF